MHAFYSFCTCSNFTHDVSKRYATFVATIFNAWVGQWRIYLSQLSATYACDNSIECNLTTYQWIASTLPILNPYRDRPCFSTQKNTSFLCMRVCDHACMRPSIMVDAHPSIHTFVQRKRQVYIVVHKCTLTLLTIQGSNGSNGRLRVVKGSTEEVGM